VTARILIDASNLVVGGGVQVAASFIGNLLERDSNVAPDWLHDCEVWVSPQVASNLGDCATHASVRVAARRWRLTPAARHKRDVVFTVFGPTYGPRVGRREVLGYADVTSIYPPVTRFGLLKLLRMRLRRILSLHSVRSADTVVVESVAMRERLVSAFGLADSRIAVSPNTWHEVFDVTPRDDEIAAARSELPRTGLLCLYVARAYPHKNHLILAPTARAAVAQGLEVRFVVTLTDDEWALLPPEARQTLINVGAKTVQELPALYAACDVVFFPSLLEASSVTPLEAMKAHKPLIASDRDFVRSVADGAALYFEPTEPDSAVRALMEVSHDPAGVEGRLDEGDRIVATWPRGRSRTDAYVRLIDDALDSLQR
jgi:glycosyltransferase involved in cell wall biosynthesis